MKHEVEEEIIRCYHCGCEISPNEGTDYSDARGNKYVICDDCDDHGWGVCYECGEAHRWLDTHPEDSDNLICEHCLHENYEECYSCGDWIHHDDAYWSERRGEWYCRSCYDNLEDPTIYGYHDSPVSYSSYIKDRNTVYMGVELEMGSAEDEYDRDKAAGLINREMNDLFHLESDCSIEAYGFETISIPLEWEDWQHKKTTMSRLYEIYRQNGLYACDSCGFHIHVSKCALSSLQWKALAWFMLKHKPIFEQIAGREENWDYARFASGRFDRDVGTFEDFCAVDLYDRYRALNLSNSRTVEFRLFASVETSKEFYKNIDITHFLIEWIRSDKTTTFKMVETPRKAFKEFIEFVASHQEDDMNYADYLSTLYFHIN